MTFIVTESCIQCVYTDCVEVCPMSCFKKGPNFMVIDPATCIDCAMCVPECPVGAIYSEHDVPDTQRHFIDINATLATLPDGAAYVTHARKTAPMADAEIYRSQTGKLALIAKK